MKKREARMNKENLIPMSRRSKSEAREMGRRGGKASGRSRREKRAFRELIALALATTVKDDQSGEELSRKELSAIRLAESCSNGDLKAIALAAELLGEKVVQADVTARVDHRQKVDIESLTDEQREVLLSIGLNIVNKTE